MWHSSQIGFPLMRCETESNYRRWVMKRWHQLVHIGVNSSLTFSMGRMTPACSRSVLMGISQVVACRFRPMQLYFMQSELFPYIFFPKKRFIVLLLHASSLLVLLVITSPLLDIRLLQHPQAPPNLTRIYSRFSNFISPPGSLFAFTFTIPRLTHCFFLICDLISST